MTVGFEFRILTTAKGFLGALAKLRKETFTFVVSVRIEQLGSHIYGFLIKFDIYVFVEKLSRKFKFQ
jgi:hypothetical protein